MCSLFAMADQDDNNQQEEPPTPSTEETSGNSSKDPIQDLRERATNMVRSGIDYARDAVETQLPQIQDQVTRGTNDASYAIGYAVSFGATLLREFSSDNVVAGYDEGSSAGGRAAEEVVKHRNRNQPANEDEEVEEGQQPTPSPG